MDFDDSGIDSDPKTDVNSDFPFTDKNEPIISFSPDRCRFDIPPTLPGSTNDNNILSFVSTPQKFNNANESASTPAGPPRTGAVSPTHSISGKSTSDLHRRLEKRIARANSNSSTSSWTSPAVVSPSAGNDPPTVKEVRGGGDQNSSQNAPQGNSTQATTSLVTNGKHPVPNSSSVPSSSSGFIDARKVPSLLPPQRLAIPNKTHHSNSSSANEGSSSENKPLVQWDSDESEEELSFFPAPKTRGILNDNLSIDNMSLSGEEDDLHLSPPRPIAHRCPCDPRLLIDSSNSSNKQCCMISTSIEFIPILRNTRNLQD
ncbi:unnamed protein product [Allacma fusca]|uniref:Uncharacterized protein n=1 Tax=Allacma fusca TaxID=39272 RepID=A0A8J2M5L8_9HEXA|nr:unnamed protein product [Allacma fusca]